MDWSPPGSSVHGILQARILEWVVMSFSRGSSPPSDRTHISYVSWISRQVLYHEGCLRSPYTTYDCHYHSHFSPLDFCNNPKYMMKVKVKVAQSCPTLANHCTIQSLGFSRPEHWSGEPFPSWGDLPNPGIKPKAPALQADALPAESHDKCKFITITFSKMTRLEMLSEGEFSVNVCRYFLWLSQQRT